MKMNKFFAALIAATMVLASCNKDETDGGLTSGEETFAGVSISIPLPLNQRAADSEIGADVNAATSTESAISNVGIFVVNLTANTIDKLYLTTTGTDFDFSAGVATAKKAIRTTTGAKSIFVVTNYDGVKATIDAMGAAAFKNNAIALTEAAFKTESGGSLVNMTMIGKTDAILTIQSEANAILPVNLIDVDLYRNLAKVVVRHDAAVTPVTGGKHQTGTLEFGLIAKANGAWLYNTPTTATGASGSATVTAYTGVPASAVSSSSDPYWNNFSDIVLGSTPGVYKQVSAFNSASNAYQTYNGWYCHENLYTELYAGNVTAARIRGKFIPNSLVTIFNASGQRTTIDNSANTVAASFYRYSDGSYWSAGAYTQATTAAPVISGSPNPQYIDPIYFSSEYVGGTGYYTIDVMDGNRVLSVKRNNYYDLAIDAIEGPGSPTEPGDPTPQKNPESYISVKVTVMPWWRHHTGHTIQ